jgi:transcriptional regulator with XRE-family HTH domain
MLRERINQPIDLVLRAQLIRILAASIRVDTVAGELGKQSRVTVNYRFSTPEAPPQDLLSIASQHGPATEDVDPSSLTHQIRRKRLSLGLKQEELAEKLEVCEATVHNWETNLRNPTLKYLPAIYEFLGTSPRPQSGSIGEQLRQYRRMHGILQEEMAKRLGIDPSTLARWERGERQPAGRLAERVSELLSDTERVSGYQHTARD